jgi:DNA polymerase III epsilon subunit-like protein
MRPGAIPVFVSHNTFRADKPILELECRRHRVRLPLHWYFFDSLHFSRSIIRNSTGNYSLSGLHEQLFNKPIENVHRARADVVACMNIMSNLTTNTWTVSGPIYPSYSTSLRSIRWVGRKAEEILYSAGVNSVESFLFLIETNIKGDYLQFSMPELNSVHKTVTQLFLNKLPLDNVTNIISVIGTMRANSPLSYTFML